MPDLKLFPHASEWVQSLLPALESARREIMLLSYIIEDDSFGARVAQILRRKAQEGVCVRVLYDDVGCFLSDGLLFDGLRAAGCDVKAYMPLRFRFWVGRHRFSRRVNHRNHRKLCLIDQQKLYLGGMNIAERYLRPDWHDLHALCRDAKCIEEAREAFLEDFSTAQYAVGRPQFCPDAERQQQFVGETTSALLLMMRVARKEVSICTPYFLPTPEFWQQAEETLQRGVAVQIVLPKRADNRWMQRGANPSIRRFLRIGGKVMLFPDGFLHTKLTLCDDRAALLGSMNLDYCSLRHNSECALLLTAERDVAACGRYLADLIQHCLAADEPRRSPWDLLVKALRPIL